MKTENDRDSFRGMRPPRAPSDLRQRVLRAATDTLELEPSQTIWDRMWESRMVGRSWATATLGLLLAHAWMAVLSDAPQSVEDLRSVERRQAREVRELLELPTVEISTRAAGLALGGRSRPRNEPRPGGSNPPSRS